MYYIFFEEEQRFTNRWLWLLLSCTSIVFIYEIFEQILVHKSVADYSQKDNVLILMGIIPLVIMYLFYKIKFTTRIDNEGIYYQFYPFHLREKKISWDEIDTIYVRKYKPIIEYGGWGIRIKPFKKDIAYNIWGNWGLQIEKSDGKRILLGTQRPEDIKRAILEIEGKL